MKKVVYSMLVVSIAMFSCGGEETKNEKKKGEKENKEEAEAEAEVASYHVDASASTLTWTGYKGTNVENDTKVGSIALMGGNFNVENGVVVSGEVEFDLSSIAETTEGADPEYSAKLIGHLLSGDFFNYEVNKTVMFAVTGSEGNTINGVLKIAGLEVPVAIPATYSADGENLVITGDFSVDLSALKMPGTQLEEGGDAEQKISDLVNFSMNIVGVKN